MKLFIILQSIFDLWVISFVVRVMMRLTQQHKFNSSVIKAFTLPFLIQKGEFDDGTRN